MPVFKILPKCGARPWFFGDRPSTKRNSANFTCLFQSSHNHVSQFPEGGSDDNFGQIVAEIDILLLLKKGTPISPHAYVPDC